MTTEKFKLAILDDFEKLADTVPGYEKLRARAEVAILRKRLATSEQIVEALRDFDAILLMRERTAFSDKEYAHLPKLKLISQTGRTSKHLDIENATERGIAVTGTPPENGIVTTELTIGLILALLRKIPQVNLRMREEAWPAIVGNSLQGKTVGVFGFGRIGREVARLIKAFPNTRVLGYSRRLSVARTALDAIARVAGTPRLPNVGSALPSLAAFHLCVPHTAPAVLRALLLHAHEAHRRSGRLFFTLALDRRDPLRVALRGLLAQPTYVGAYATTPGGKYRGPRLDGLPLHFESALV